MDAKQKQSIDKILSSSDLTFGKESFIYTFTNEDIKSYLTYFPLKEKEILTVTGSGDHILNMLLDVDQLDTFDINLFAYYFFVLKKYAIASLELDEYLDFLSMTTPSFDQKTFGKIKQVWKDEKDALDFFEYIFHIGQASYLKQTPLFVNNKIEDKEENISRNRYLEEEQYYALKKTILDKRVLFHHSAIQSLQLEQKFDYIFLSNITDYLHNMFTGDVLKKYKKFLYSSLIPMLKEDGKIISYLYDGEMKGCNQEEVRNTLCYHFSAQVIGKDKILIYTKEMRK